MKPQVIPDYQRHTNFTIEERLMLAEIARVRIELVTRLCFLKLQRQQLVISQVDDRLIDMYDNQIAHLKWTVGSLDETIFDMYKEHGRLN
jgi:hypothetical protein